MNVLMSPARIDRFGNMNISVMGDWKKLASVLAAARGVPDNTTNGQRVYHIVHNPSPRVFVDQVDFVCWLGGGEDRARGLIKYDRVEKVFSNLGVMDFEERTGLMRLESVHVGGTPQQVIENTCFELVMPNPVPETPSPTLEELRLVREVIGPRGIRRLYFLKGDAYKQAMSEIGARR